MNKYEKEVIKTEVIAAKINKAKLSLLLACFKKFISKQNKFNDIENISNNLCLTIILNELSNYKDLTQKTIRKKLINKLNKENIFKDYIMFINYLLLNKDYEQLNVTLESFIKTGLIKTAKLIKNNKQDYIEATLINDDKIHFSYASANNDVILKNKHKCHLSTYNLINEKKDNRNVVIALEDFELFGSFYHSFVVENNCILDLSQNIIMTYEDYLKVIKPKILVYEDARSVIKNIEELKNDKNYSSSNYYDILKYGVSKQLKYKK